MQAILLAGGLGTRLRSVVSDRPKPMALIEGKPFMEYVTRELVRHRGCKGRDNQRRHLPYETAAAG